jgi:hypothetical protein
VLTAFSEVRSIEEGRVFSLLKPQPFQLAADFLLVAPEGGGTGMGGEGVAPDGVDSYVVATTYKPLEQPATIQGACPDYSSRCAHP